MSVQLVAEAFASLDDARAYLNLQEDDNERDDLLCELINRAARLFVTFVGRTLKLTTYSNKALDGTGDEDLFLPEYPVTAISSLKVSDSREFDTAVALVVYDGTGTQDPAAVNVVLDAEAGILTRSDGEVWPEGPATVRLSYSAGMDATSGQDVKQAELIQVAQWWFSIGENPLVTNTAMGGVQETIQDLMLSDKVRAMLAQYRRPSCVA